MKKIFLNFIPLKPLLNLKRYIIITNSFASRKKKQMPETEESLFEAFEKKALTKQSAALDINELTIDPNVIKLYGNGFTYGFSMADASIVIQRGTHPVALLNLSFTALKTFANGLNEFVKTVEDNLGHELRDMNEVRQNFKQ